MASRRIAASISPFTVRKLIGSVVLVVWMAAYIAVAAVIGDRIAYEHWAWKLLYFPIAGLAWVLPLRPLLRWMQSQDAPAETTDV